MRKTDHVVLIHGYAETPDRAWFPWLHKELEALGLRVTVPALPDPLRPDHRKWLRAVVSLMKHWDRNTIVVGHSLGGVVALRALQKRPQTRIGGLILVATPFASTLRISSLIRFFDIAVDWWMLRESAKTHVVVQAVDDPLVPFDHALRHAEALGADVLLTKKGGHFTGKTAPAVLKAIRKMMG